jgi:hypothetical protein
LPQAPQFERSVASSAQKRSEPPSIPVVVLHSVAVPVHMNVHAPPEQTWSGPHAVPQAPQLRRSVWIDVHRAAPASAPASPAEPAQRRSPAAQLGMHAPF